PPGHVRRRDPAGGASARIARHRPRRGARAGGAVLLRRRAARDAPRRGGRVRSPRGPGPNALGSLADRARRGPPRASIDGEPDDAVAPRGGHRLRAFDCAVGASDGLAAHRRALRRAPRAHAGSDRRPEPRARRGGAARARRRPRCAAGRRRGREAVPLPLLLGRARGHRAARRPPRRGAAAVRARDRARAEPGGTPRVREKARDPRNMSRGDRRVRFAGAPFVLEAGGHHIMRRIIESTLVSLDGVIADPQLWAMEYFDQEAQEEALEVLLASDAMLMGRRTYEIFARLWPARSGAYPDRINAMPKYVFSSTLQRAEWNNST